MKQRMKNGLTGFDAKAHAQTRSAPFWFLGVDPAWKKRDAPWYRPVNSSLVNVGVGEANHTLLAGSSTRKLFAEVWGHSLDAAIPTLSAIDTLRMYSILVQLCILEAGACSEAVGLTRAMQCACISCPKRECRDLPPYPPFAAQPSHQLRTCKSSRSVRSTCHFQSIVTRSQQTSIHMCTKERQHGCTTIKHIHSLLTAR
jgi:hypothetical protein